MKIAVAADTAERDARVSMHAARAPFYLAYEENGAFAGAISNPNSAVERGAAPKAAALLREHGIDVLVAGEFGSRFVADLEDAHITFVRDSGAVADVVSKVLGHTGNA